MDGPAGPDGTPGRTETPGGEDANTTASSPGDQGKERAEGQDPESLAQRQARQRRAIRQAKADLAKQQRNQRARPWTAKRLPGSGNGPGMIRRQPPGGAA